MPSAAGLSGSRSVGRELGLLCGAPSRGASLLSWLGTGLPNLRGPHTSCTGSHLPPALLRARWGPSQSHGGTPAGCSGWGRGREAEAASTLRSWWAGVSGWTGVPWWAGGSWCAGVVHTVCRKEPGMSGQDCDLSWHRGGWLRAPRPLYPGALPRARSGTASSGQGRRQCPGAWKSRLCPETQGAL